MMGIDDKGTWRSAVVGILAGHGFIDALGHVEKHRAYLDAAWAYRMTAVRCAANLAKAHEEERIPSHPPCTACGRIDCDSPQFEGSD